MMLEVTLLDKPSDGFASVMTLDIAVSVLSKDGNYVVMQDISSQGDTGRICMEQPFISC